MFVSGKPFQPRLLIASNAGAYPFGFSTLGHSPALLTNIRLGCKGLPRTNAQAYYGHLKITVVKSFITLEPEHVVSMFKNFFLRH